MEQTVRRIVREELAQLFGDLRTNIDYTRDKGHPELNWEGLEAWVVETARDNDKVMERREGS